MEVAAGGDGRGGSGASTELAEARPATSRARARVAATDVSEVNERIEERRDLEGVFFPKL